jgi:UDP-glucose 4-epimerase
MSQTEDVHPVVITGAAGLLGSAVVEKLAGAGRVLRCVDVVPLERQGVSSFVASIDDRAVISKMVEGCEVLVHLAWKGVAALPPEGTSRNVSDNLVGSLAMLEQAQRGGVKRVVFASSGGTVYGAQMGERLSEDVACRPISVYGAEKVAFEALAHAFCHAHDMSFLSLRVSNLYGPGQRGNMGQGLVATAIWKALKDEALELWGDGSVTRDYVYITDVAEAFAQAVNYSGESEIINVGTGIARTVTDVVECIERVFRKRIEVHYRAARRADVPYNVLDVTRASKLLGWSAATDFETGVRQSLAWSRRSLKV